MLWLGTFLPLVKLRPRIVITEASIVLLSTWLLFFGRPLFRWKIIFWTHGFEDFWSTSPRLTHGDRIRKLLFDCADAIITYGGAGAGELRSVLGNKAKVFDAPNTIDPAPVNSERAMLESLGRHTVRANLSMSGFSMVWLGRLSHEKQVMDIPPLIRSLVRNGGQYELHVIGDGSLRRALEEEMTAIQGCRTVFYGALVTVEEKGPILFASDCHLGTGAQGLSIVDALGYGCPTATISQDRLQMKHGPELQYLHDKVNSIIAESLDDLALRIEALAGNPDLQSTMRSNALESFLSECNIERQFAGVCRAIEFCEGG